MSDKYNSVRLNKLRTIKILVICTLNKSKVALGLLLLSECSNKLSRIKRINRNIIKALTIKLKTFKTIQ